VKRANYARESQDILAHYWPNMEDVGFCANRFEHKTDNFIYYVSYLQNATTVFYVAIAIFKQL